MKFNRITSVLMLSTLPAFANAASYTIVELPTNELSINQFANNIDDTDLVLTIVSQPFNSPIDLTQLDLDAFTNLTDPDAAAQGNFNATDLFILDSFVRSQTSVNNPFGQKLANFVGYQTNGTDFSYVNGFDTESDNLNGFSFAHNMRFGGSVNGTHIVGDMNGPYALLEYTNEDNEDLVYNINGYNSRAFVQVGDTVTALPPETTVAGGISFASAINDGLMVAGLTTIGYSVGVQNAIDNCQDESIRGDIPEEVCLFQLRNASNSIFLTGAKRRAAIWQVDANGAVINKTVYGLLFEPEEDTTAAFASEASDINDNGVAVGYSQITINDRITTVAAKFENSEVTRLIADDDFAPNIATGINNNDFVVGFRQQVINGVSRSRLFVLNQSTQDIVNPEGFFVSSSTNPRAINDNNLVVGEAEAEASNGVRQRNGFLYDIDNSTFSNLNDLIACDSDYTIITANDINNNDVIIADALLKRPARDIKGEIVLDDSGNQVITDTVVAVKLEPTGQAPSVCEPSEEDAAQTERQGAGFSIVLSILLTAFIAIRRKIFS